MGGTGKDQVFIKELLDGGKLAPVIDRSYVLSEVSDALRYFQKDTPEEKSSSRCDLSRVFKCSHQPVVILYMKSNVLSFKFGLKEPSNANQAGFLYL